MRTERRVVIKRSAELEAGIELAGPDEEYLGLPFEIATEDLTASEAADRRRDERVEDVMPSINLSLIAPLDVPSQSGEAGDAWGIAAVGADRCVEDGRGVTVAILDTGIDRHHSAFAKTKPMSANLITCRGCSQPCNRHSALFRPSDTCQSGRLRRRC